MGQNKYTVNIYKSLDIKLKALANLYNLSIEENHIESLFYFFMGAFEQAEGTKIVKRSDAN